MNVKEVAGKAWFNVCMYGHETTIQYIQVCIYEYGYVHTYVHIQSR